MCPKQQFPSLYSCAAAPVPAEWFQPRGLAYPTNGTVDWISAVVGLDREPEP